VRTNIEYRNGHIASALHIPLSELRSRLGELEPYRDRDIFTYCLTGIRSYYALRILRLNGYDNVYNLSGSWKTWTSHFLTRGEDGARLLPNTEAVED